MKVLVTGACGFIGRNVVSKLVECGIDVIASDVLPIEESGYICYNNIGYVAHDFCDNNPGLMKKFSNPDLIIHLAWEGLPNYFEDFHVTLNAIESYKFIKQLVDEGLKKVVGIGTCMEYGMVNGEISDDFPTNPITKYAIGKDLLRRMLSMLGVNFKWLRLFYMYGPGQSEKTLYGQLDRAIRMNELDFKMSYGEQIRDYLHVKDVSEYIVKASLQDKVFGSINICSGIPISVRRFVENIIKERGSLLSVRVGERPYTSYEPLSFWGGREKLEMILNES